MRRIFVVGVLLAMMIGLAALQAEKSGGADPLTLATIGFVVLAAFALAELGSSLGLPKVTGYILAGVTLGPFAANIMSSNVVGEIRMFNTLALGLIATTAGLELDLGGLRKLAKTLTVTIVLKIVLGVVMVGGTLFVIEANFNVLGLADQPKLIAIALVFAALSLGTSPAIALAIISESHSKGRLSDLILGAAIVKDVVVVVCLAVAVATAKALTGAGALGIDVLLHVGEELGASILAGTVLGGLLIAYLRWIKAEMLLFVAAMILVVAELTAALHLELLLVFIVAGLVVRNFSKHEHDLLHPLETVSLPVFIVFFTNAGASVDLGATFSVLPLALAVCAARALAFVVSGIVGGKLGGETVPVQRLAWLGYLPQAGVTLGLIGLAAGQLSESIGSAVATLGMAVVAVNLLAGPVTMRIALRGAGEIPSDEPQEDAEPKGKPTLHVVAAELEDPGLAAVISKGIEFGQSQVQDWIDTVARPRIEEQSDLVLKGLEKLKDPTRMRKLVSDLKSTPLDSKPAVSAGLFLELAEHCTELPDERRVPLEPMHRVVQESDGRWVRLVKRASALGALLTFRYNRRTRKVPVRLVARTRLEPKFVDVASELQSSVHRFELMLVTVVEDVAAGTRTVAEAIRAVQDRTPRALTSIHRKGDQGISDAFKQLAQTLAVVGTGQLPVSKVRYSSVERQVRSGVKQLEDDAAGWGRRRSAAWSSALVVAAINGAQHETDAALEAKVTGPFEQGFLAVSEAATTLDRRLAELTEKVDDIEVDRLDAEIRALLPKPQAKAMRSALGDARKAPSAARVIEPLMPEVPERTSLIRDLRTLATEPRPAAARVVEVPIRERVSARIEEKLAEPLETVIDEARERLDEADKMIGDALGLLEFLQRSIVEAEDEAAATTARKALKDGLEQTRPRLAPLMAQTVERAQQVRADVAGALEASYGSLTDELVGASSGMTQHGEVLRRRKRPLGRASTAVARGFYRMVDGLRALLRGEDQPPLQSRPTAVGRFDPGDMRESLLAMAKVRARRAGPPVYEQLFSTEPVRDPVLFVAHRRQLEALVQAERTWRDDKSAGNAVLVVGGSGSGKTSMLAVGRMKVGLRHSVVVGRREPGAQPRLLSTLTHRIGCDDAPDALVKALTGVRTLVSVDDLHTWIDSSPSGIAQLRELLEIVEKTGGDAFWVLSIDRQAFRILDEIVPMRGWFAQVLEMPQVTADGLQTVISTRHRPTSAPLDFPDDGFPGVRAALDRTTPQDRYLSTLARRARGNLRRAIELWSAHAVTGEETRVRMERLDVPEIGLEFWPSFDLDTLALLSMLLRCGARTLDQLSVELETDARRAVRLAITAGLVQEIDGEFDIDPGARDDVEAALRHAGVLASKEVA